MQFFIRLQTWLKPYLPLLLRLGLGFIFFWSGLSKLIGDSNALGVCTNRSEAVSLVSGFTWLPMDPMLFVMLQSIAEVIAGAMLILGLWVEAASFACLILFSLFFALLHFSLVWKNVGLSALALAVFTAAPDRWRLDRRFAPRPPLVPGT